MLKKFILLLCLVAPVALVAQEKIAFVDTNEIMSKLPELKDMETKIAAKGETLQKSLQAIETEYQGKLEEYGKKLEKFQAGGSEISESELLDSQKSLTQIQERYETHAQSSNAEFEKYRQELFLPVQQKIEKAIKDVGAENNYSYILDRGALLYVGTSAVDAGKLVKTKLGITN